MDEKAKEIPQYEEPVFYSGLLTINVNVTLVAWEHYGGYIQRKWTPKHLTKVSSLSRTKESSDDGNPAPKVR